MVLLKLSQKSQENTCVGVFFLIKLRACNFSKRETPTQVFPYEFYEIFKNAFFHRTPPVAAFVFVC